MRVVRSGERRSVSRSATRALDVLEYFGQVRRPLRAVEIARRLSLHPSTANQLLKTMVESAHLAFDAATKTYLPSPRLARFSTWMVEAFGSDESLRRLLAEIHDATGEVATLTTPNDLYMQVIEVAGYDAFETPSDGAERGLRVSMFGSAIGSAYLSTLPPAEVRRLAERARIPDSEHRDVIAQCALIRRRGFAEAPSAEGRFWSIAVPVPGACSNVPLVLGLAGPSERITSDLSQLSQLLRSGIDRLAKRI